MANRNITVIRSQFKDYISAKERLLICGVDCDPKNTPANKSRSLMKNGESLCRSFFRLKIMSV